MRSGSPKSGAEFADRLIRDNLGLITQVVSRVAARYPRHVDRQELWNAGALGLVEAAQRYDATTGIPFERYAAIRIRGAIIDSTRSRDWASRSVRRRYREMEAASAAFTEGAGRIPDRAELAAMLGITEAELDKIQARSARSMLLYLDNDQTGDGPALRDTVVDEDETADPAVALEQREMFGTLRSAVEALPGVHGDVIRRYYLQGELLQDIAVELGVTQARVSQIRSEALCAMRVWFGGMYEGVPEVDKSAPGKRARAAYVSQLSQQSTWRSRLDSADLHEPMHGRWLASGT